jgi:hypothetical protein
MSVHVIFVNTYLIIFNIKVAYNDDKGTANSRRYKRTSLHKTIFFLMKKLNITMRPITRNIIIKKQ